MGGSRQHDDNDPLKSRDEVYDELERRKRQMCTQSVAGVQVRRKREVGSVLFCSDSSEWPERWTLISVALLNTADT